MFVNSLNLPAVEVSHYVWNLKLHISRWQYLFQKKACTIDSSHKGDISENKLTNQQIVSNVLSLYQRLLN